MQPSAEIGLFRHTIYNAALKQVNSVSVSELQSMSDKMFGNYSKPS